ncbi:MAG: hypothetical protein GDA56_25720 [Hormoscilla sp. GM7CHS1pb]|nr:hypothetical protein [Hormoscilla sp. GM7CHS1pb]
MLKHYTSGSALILDILAILFVACSHNEVTDASNNVSSRPTMDGGPAPVAPPYSRQAQKRSRIIISERVSKLTVL